MNRFLRKAILREITPYTAVLPYNINWMLSKRDSVISRGLSAPITVVDVGCRGGLPDELWPIRQMIHHIGFDADPQECDRLNSQKHELSARNIYPFFVAGEDGKADFHLYKSRGESSALLPDPRFAALFAGKNFAVEQTITVDTITLDSFFDEHPDLPRPDMIKLDTQGTELTVLKGSTKCLETCSFVEVEVEFLPMYKGQPLFHEVMGFMLDHGFELLYINRVFQQRKGYSGFSKAQITFGDALFVRREDHLAHFNNQRLLSFLVILINYGYLDLAHNLLTTQPFDENTKRFYDQYLQKRVGRWKIRQVKRAIITFVDKLILLLLHLKMHNGLNIDSDRSWPYR